MLLEAIVHLEEGFHLAKTILEDLLIPLVDAFQV